MISISKGMGGLLALCLAASLCGGCGGGGGGDSSSTSVATTPAPGTSTGGGGGGAPTPVPTLSQSGKTSDGLTLTLAEDKATVPVGGAETYTISVINTTANAVGISAVLGGQKPAPDATLEVVNSAGIVVFPQRKPGLAPPPPPVNNVVTLTPGDSLSETVVVAAFAAADTYTATAIFRVTDSVSKPPETVQVSGLQVTAH